MKEKFHHFIEIKEKKPVNKQEITTMTELQIRADVRRDGRKETRRNIKALITELSKCEGLFDDYITTTYVNAKRCRVL